MGISTSPTRPVFLASYAFACSLLFVCWVVKTLGQVHAITNFFSGVVVSQTTRLFAVVYLPLLAVFTWVVP
jgi:hypothetical protein